MGHKLGHLNVLGGGRSPESLSTGQGGGEEICTTGIVPNVRVTERHVNAYYTVMTNVSK